MNVGNRVKIVKISIDSEVNDEEALERFVGQEGVVSYIYPSDNAPFPIYVDFDEDNKGIPFQLSEVMEVGK